MRVRLDQKEPISTTSESDYNNEAFLTFRRRSLDELYQTKTLLVELTLADGRNSILEIKPQDPSFATFRTKCPVLIPEPAPPPPPKSTEVKLPMSDRNLQSAYGPAPQFLGTLATLVGYLPDLVRQHAEANHIDPNHFDAEVPVLINALKLCVAISPKMINSVTDANGLADLSLLGERYAPCGQRNIYISSSGEISPRLSDKTRGFVLHLILPNLTHWKRDPSLARRFANRLSDVPQGYSQFFVRIEMNPELLGDKSAIVEARITQLK